MEVETLKQTLRLANLCYYLTDYYLIGSASITFACELLLKSTLTDEQTVKKSLFKMKL